MEPKTTNRRILARDPSICLDDDVDIDKNLQTKDRTQEDKLNTNIRGIFPDVIYLSTSSQSRASRDDCRDPDIVRSSSSSDDKSLETPVPVDKTIPRLPLIGATGCSSSSFSSSLGSNCSRSPSPKPNVAHGATAFNVDDKSYGRSPSPKPNREHGSSALNVDDKSHGPTQNNVLYRTTGITKPVFYYNQNSVFTRDSQDSEVFEESEVKQHVFGISNAQIIENYMANGASILSEKGQQARSRFSSSGYGTGSGESAQGNSASKSTSQLSQESFSKEGAEVAYNTSTRKHNDIKAMSTENNFAQASVNSPIKVPFETSTKPDYAKFPGMSQVNGIFFTRDASNLGPHSPSGGMMNMNNQAGSIKPHSVGFSEEYEAHHPYLMNTSHFKPLPQTTVQRSALQAAQRNVSPGYPHILQQSVTGNLAPVNQFQQAEASFINPTNQLPHPVTGSMTPASHHQAVTSFMASPSQPQYPLTGTMSVARNYLQHAVANSMTLNQLKHSQTDNMIPATTLQPPATSNMTVTNQRQQAVTSLTTLAAHLHPPVTGSVTLANHLKQPVTSFTTPGQHQLAVTSSMTLTSQLQHPLTGDMIPANRLQPPTTTFTTATNQLQLPAISNTTLTNQLQQQLQTFSMSGRNSQADVDPPLQAWSSLLHTQLTTGSLACSQCHTNSSNGGSCFVPASIDDKWHTEQSPLSFLRNLLMHSGSGVSERSLESPYHLESLLKTNQRDTTLNAAVAEVQAQPAANIGIPKFDELLSDSSMSNTSSVELSSTGCHYNQDVWQKLLRSVRCNDVDCDVTDCLQMKKDLAELSDDRNKVSALSESHKSLLLTMFAHMCDDCDHPKCPFPWCGERIEDIGQLSEEGRLRFMKCRMENFVDHLKLSSSPVKYMKLIQDLPHDLMPMEEQAWIRMCMMGNSRRTVLVQPVRSGQVGGCPKKEYWVIKKVSTSDDWNHWGLFSRLRNIQHRSVAKFLWAAGFEDHVLVCSQYEGLPLHEHLTSQQENQFVPVFKIMLQLLSATRFLNNNRIVYLNWISKNILVTGDTKTELNVKLCNFTCSALLDRYDGGFLYLALPRHIIAPELRDNMEVKVASDVWGIGCLLHELVTGKPVWQEHRHTLDREFKALTQDKPKIPTVHSELTAIFSSCWEIDPRKRPTTDDLDIKMVTAYRLHLRKVEFQQL